MNKYFGLYTGLTDSFVEKWNEKQTNKQKTTKNLPINKNKSKIFFKS